jgi:hypothetical protein
MSTATARFATKEPTSCAVCRRHAIWVGYAPLVGKWQNFGGPVVWLCDDDGCHRAARSVYHMPNPTLDAFEIGAALEAGANAGGYLEEIGATDLSKLSAEEWREFLRRLITGFEQVLRRKILGNEAPL